MIKLAIIGAGRHSSLHHGPAIAALKHRLRRAVVVDRNAVAGEKYAQAFKLDQAYVQIDRMLEIEKPDALIVVTPEQITATMVRELLPCQLPMLVEKPFGENLTQAQQLCDEVQANPQQPARIMLSMNRRFAPVCLKAMQFLKERFTSRPVQHIRGTMLRHARFDSNFLPATGVHVIDTVHMFAGSPAIQVSPQISQLSNAGIGAVSAQLQFTNGLTGDLLIHTDCGQLAEQYDIFGSGYRICVDYFHGLTVYESDQIVYQQMYPQAIPIPQREGAITELEAFLDHVESGDLILSPNPNDALAAAWVADQLQACALDNRNELDGTTPSSAKQSSLSTTL